MENQLINWGVTLDLLSICGGSQLRACGPCCGTILSRFTALIDFLLDHRGRADRPALVLDLICLSESSLEDAILGTTMMVDPFEVRMRFTQQLHYLSASVTSAQKTAQYALKYRDLDEDLHSCILEQLERVRIGSWEILSED